MEEFGAFSGVILQEAIPQSLQRWAMVFMKAEKDAPAFHWRLSVGTRGHVPLHSLSHDSVKARECTGSLSHCVCDYALVSCKWATLAARMRKEGRCGSPKAQARGKLECNWLRSLFWTKLLRLRSTRPLRQRFALLLRSIPTMSCLTR